MKFTFMEFIFIMLFPVLLFSAFEDRPGVRSCAMGNAYTSIANDAYAAYWNPALLSRLNSVEIATDFRKYLWNLDNDDLSYTYIAFAYPFGRWGTLSVNGGMFKANIYSENRFGLQYGFHIIQDKFGIGFSIDNLSKRFSLNKYINDDPLFDNYGTRVNNYVISSGLYANIFRNFMIGLSIKNINEPNIALNKEDKDILPINTSFGLSYYWRWFLFAMDIEWQDELLNDERIIRIHSGLECKLNNKLKLQTGYDSKFVSFGFTLNFPDKQWINKIVDPITSREIVDIKSINCILNYCVRYPFSGIYSTYGDHYIGLRLQYSNSRAESQGVTKYAPSRIKTETRYETKVRIDTMFIEKVRLDTLVKETIIKDTIIIEKPVPDSTLLAMAAELEAQKVRLAEQKKINEALKHLLNSLKLYYANEFESAEKECRTAINLAPNLVLGYLRLGSILYRQGKVDEAMKYWKKAYKMDPNNEELKKIFESGVKQ